MTDPSLGRLNMVFDGLTKDLATARAMLKSIQDQAAKNAVAAVAPPATADGSTIKTNSFNQSYVSAVPLSLLQAGTADFQADAVFESSGGAAFVKIKTGTPGVNVEVSPMVVDVTATNVVAGDPLQLTMTIDATGLTVAKVGAGNFFKIAFGTPTVASVGGAAAGNGNLDLYAGGSAYFHADSAASKVTMSEILVTTENVTTSTIGTLTLTNKLAIGQGGTGQSTAALALAALGGISGSGYGAGSATLVKITALGADGSLSWDTDGCISGYSAPT